MEVDSFNKIQYKTDLKITKLERRIVILEDKVNGLEMGIKARLKDYIDNKLKEIDNVDHDTR